MNTNAKIWRNFRLLVFYVLQISIYTKLFFTYLRDPHVFFQLAVFELGSIIIDLFKGFYKYAVNFYEAFIEATWGEKSSWFSFFDMVMAVIEISFKIFSLSMFMIKFNYPIAWARDIIFAIASGMKRIREYIKGRRLIKKVRKFKKVKAKEEEVCGICLIKIVEGKQLPCSHVFHESCLV